MAIEGFTELVPNVNRFFGLEDGMSLFRVTIIGNESSVEKKLRRNIICSGAMQEKWANLKIDINATVHYTIAI